MFVQVMNIQWLMQDFCTNNEYSVVNTRFLGMRDLGWTADGLECSPCAGVITE